MIFSLFRRKLELLKKLQIVVRPPCSSGNQGTNVRIVFDASATSEVPSLNECMYKVPQLTPLIFNIFLRFLTFLIAMTSDIAKAFL